MMDIPCLEVLIPTFGRTSSAIRAIRSVVSCDDNRIRVRCNSNGRDEKLEAFCHTDSRISFDFFEENQGPSENFYKLYRESKSLFCMLLSDEDTLLPNEVPQFLDFLEAVEQNCNLISSSVWIEEQNDFYIELSPAFDDISLNIAAFTIATTNNYISGYVFRTEALQRLDLLNLCGLPNPVHSRHAYGHIDIAQALLTSGSHFTYRPKMVIRGSAVEQGGDAFAHRTASESTMPDNLNLNPETYGPYARASQYFYREYLLQGLRPHFTPLTFIAAEIGLFTWSFKATLDSPKVALLGPNESVPLEAERAIIDAQAAGCFSGSNYSYLYFNSVTGPTAEALAILDWMARVRDSLPWPLLVQQFRY